MKFELIHFPRKVLRFFRAISGFRKAVAISVFLHLLAFVTLGFFFGFLSVPPVFEPPLVFDFVFEPTEPDEESSLDGDSDDPNNPLADSKEEAPSKPVESDNPGQHLQEIQQQIAASPVSPSQPSNITESSDELVDDLTTSDPLDMTDPSPERPAEPDMTPIVPNRDFKERLSVPTTLQPSELTIKQYDLRDADPIPARLSISKKQHEMLVKQSKKWAEKFHDMKLTDSTYVWEHKGKEYRAQFEHQPAQNDTELDQLIVNVVTSENGQEVKTRMRMKRLAFSSYAQFVDRWDPQVAVHDDILEGRFHSNSEFVVSEFGGKAPVFNGKVTTSSFSVKHIDAFQKQILFPRSYETAKLFHGGLETGVKSIRLPKHFTPFLTDSTISENRIHRFAGKTRITFHADGTFSWRDLETGATSSRVPIPEDTFYIIGSNKKKELRLKGVLRGKVLVYAAGKVIIDDDITYSKPPDANGLSGDYLGIVSEKDVIIAEPKVTGPGDLYIYAAIYAKGRFSVPNRTRHGHATMYVYGSLTAGSISATEPRYATKITFDQRLEQRRPPGFPITDRYEVIEWDKSWETRTN